MMDDWFRWEREAAIISRELGIPCIVGTKNATEVLKTGQMVEVDADKGEVRLI